MATKLFKAVFVYTADEQHKPSQVFSPVHLTTGVIDIIYSRSFEVDPNTANRKDHAEIGLAPPPVKPTKG